MASYKTPEEALQAHIKDVQKSLEKHGLRMHLVVEFPLHVKPPRIARFGTWLVNKYGGRIAVKYEQVGDIITSKSTKRRIQ